MTNILDLATAIIIPIGIIIMVVAGLFMLRAHREGAKTWEKVGFYVFMIGFFLALAEGMFNCKYFFDESSNGWEAFRLMGTMCWFTLGVIGLLMANHISKTVEDLLL